MGKIGPEFLKLDNLVAKETALLKHKFSFWGVNPAVDANWSGDTSSAGPDYQELIVTLQSITEIDNLPTEQQALIGVGWEFVWGITPPEEITQLRETVQNKARYGGNLSDVERLWLQIIAVDTDSF